MDFKDYYKVMGLADQATAADVKYAYRKLAKKFHPDVSHELNAKACFQDVGEAYEVLSNTEKRAEYTRIKALQENRARPRNTGSGSHLSEKEVRRHFSDLFKSTFGAPRGGYRPSNDKPKDSAFSYRGKDLKHRLVVRLEEAVKGGQRTLKLEMPITDTGTQGPSKNKTLNVKIPAGILSLQRIRLIGQGQPGFGGGSNGDLLLEIELAPHPLFTVDGKNILFDLPVSPWEAELGAKVKVPTLTGTVSLNIPEGSVSGRKLRLKGRGLGLNPPGDQIIKLQVTLPAQHSAKAKVLYQQLAEL